MMLNYEKKDEDDVINSSKEEEEGDNNGKEEENDARGRGNNNNFEQNSLSVALSPLKQCKKRHTPTQHCSNQVWGSASSYITLFKYNKGNLNTIPTGSTSPSAATARNTNPTFAAVNIYIYH
eukprot:9636565-Ditylum_brightwellii.AAC.1